MTFTRGLGAVLVASSIFLGSTAQAESADELFERGRKLAVAQRYAEACPLLAESVRTEPGIGARLWLGECYEKTGRLASALAEFKAAADAAAERKDDRQKVAQKRAAVLESRVPRIVIAGAEDVALTLDDKPAAAGVGDPVDAGLHTITARAPGFVPWSVSVAVPEAPGVVTVNVPALVRERVETATRAAEPARVVEKPVVVNVRQAPSLGPLKLASIATGALGIAALGGGVFLGLQAKTTYDSSNHGGHCVGNACDASGKDLRASARSMATLSTIAFAGAGAAIAGSIVFFLLAPSTSLTPVAGPHEAGLSLVRRF